ncbi:MAG TPA: hypothetical protein DIC19_04770 [Erysipelotrichaceae bacterium]|nr:hypothetical protein [Erysipelotrichaceae bacterium]
MAFEKRLQKIYAALCLVLPLFIWPKGGDSDHFYLPKVIMLAFFCLVLLVYMIYHQHDIKKFKVMDPIMAVSLTFLLMLTISLFFALDLRESLLGRVYRYEGYLTIVMYLFLFWGSRFIRDDQWILRMLLAGVVIQAIYGIAQSFGFDPVLRDNVRSGWVSTFGTLGNPNFYGSFMVMALPLSIWFMFKQQLQLGAVIYAFVFYALLASMTRGAWLGAVVGLFVTLWLARKSASYLSKISLIFVISFVLLVQFNTSHQNQVVTQALSIPKEAVDVLVQAETAPQAGSYRIFIWTHVLELIEARPLTGYGFDYLPKLFFEYYQKDMQSVMGRLMTIDKAHNEYLNIAVSAGIPSLLAYLALLFIVLKTSISKGKNLLFAVIIAYLIQAFFNISVVSVAYLFWILLGRLVPYASKSIPEAY